MIKSCKDFYLASCHNYIKQYRFHIKIQYKMVDLTYFFKPKYYPQHFFVNNGALL
jgi:hypothetical protein